LAAVDTDLLPANRRLNMIIKVLDKKTPEALLVPLIQDEQLGNRLELIAQRAGIDASLLQQDFKADSKETFVLYAGNAPMRRLYLLGLGKKAGFPEVQAAFRAFSHRFKQKLPLRVGIDLRDLPADLIPRLSEAAVCGMLLGLYQIGLFQSDREQKPAPQFGSSRSQLDLLVAPELQDSVDKAIHRAEVFAEASVAIFDLMNTPGNYKKPQQVSDLVLALAEKHEFSASVLDKTALEKIGMGALLGVGQGSVNPPALLVLEYGARPRKQKRPVLGLVGKGVTFDTGGISIKPSGNMQYMKSDLGGAAAVIGAFMVIARLQLPIRLVAENMPDAAAIKPGDVLRSFSGKTIEVTDTDAEGRLILADALSFLIDREKCDVLIDLATLTGSIIRAIGTQAAGLFSSNELLIERLRSVGANCGERLWPMPMWEEYGSDLKSDVADLRNFTGKPMAESISAAKFLEHFTAKHPAWAHLDIAGTAFGDSEFATTKSGTAFGVRLLVEFAEQMHEHFGA
jgi:leucyl aminopeptidase